jgi:hypothetical protein
MDVQFLSFSGVPILIYPAVVHLVPILDDPLNDHIWTSAGHPTGISNWIGADIYRISYGYICASRGPKSRKAND